MTTQTSTTKSSSFGKPAIDRRIRPLTTQTREFQGTTTAILLPQQPQHTRGSETRWTIIENCIVPRSATDYWLIQLHPSPLPRSSTRSWLSVWLTIANTVGNYWKNFKLRKFLFREIVVGVAAAAVVPTLFPPSSLAVFPTTFSDGNNWLTSILHSESLTKCVAWLRYLWSTHSSSWLPFIVGDRRRTIRPYPSSSLIRIGWGVKEERVIHSRMRLWQENPLWTDFNFRFVEKRNVGMGK